MDPSADRVLAEGVSQRCLTASRRSIGAPRLLPTTDGLLPTVGVIRLLHTADWHLGATLQGWSREAEHRAALAQLVGVAKERAVDAVVVAGDVFDSLNPSADAQRLLYETLRDLRGACPHARIVLIAGNHDPAARLEAPRALFEMADVVSIGAFARREGAFDARAHLLPVRNRRGEVGAYILALPYPRAVDLPVANENPAGAVREMYREAVEGARREIGTAPLIVTGHLHVAGAIESEGAERRIIVGGEHALPPDVFAPDIAYVALGHLHRRQSVGRETIRYSGSLIPMSKTEIDYAHGVSIVDIGDSGVVAMEHAAFDRAVRHLRVPSHGALSITELEPALEALDLDAAAPTDAWPFAHLAIRVDGPAAGLKAELDAICEKFPLRVVSTSVERPQAQAATASPPARAAERKPAVLFREAIEQAHGVAPTADQ
ncbi:metallophosphoesterase family protein, partial [Methylocystis sp.]|uniref:metallophosphoesterase family protein n=1 Tax=Methylocystis sp. TaxID=1911079 RepID=UPI003D0D66B2